MVGIAEILAGRNQRNYYGEKLALIAQLQIIYTDGTSETIGTDENWKATTGPIIFGYLQW